MNRSGFTLVELLIYSVIFSIISLTLVYFLTLFFRVITQQSSSSELSAQANFILQKIQNEIAKASFIVVNNDGNDEIDAALGQPHAQLIIKDRTETTGESNDQNSPIIIYKNGVDVVLKRGNQEATALNTNRITVADLTFTKVSTPPGRDVVLINLTLRYNNPNPAQQLTRQFTLGVGRAAAATFDTDIIPGASGTKDVGGNTAKWRSLFLSQNISTDGAVVWSGSGAGSNNSIGFLRKGSWTINPPSIAANTNYSTTTTVGGAVTNDQVFVTAPSDLDTGLVMVGAKATGTDTLTLTIRNVTGAAVDGASRTWSYLIIR